MVQHMLEKVASPNVFNLDANELARCGREQTLAFKFRREGLDAH